MKLALAQLRPVKGNIAENTVLHKNMIALAVAQQADAIFFPELSLTGYEPGLAKNLAINADDPLLDDFQEISNQSAITIGIGAPTVSDVGLHISMLIFQPGAARQTYSKQMLHTDELPYFVSGNKQVVLTVKGERIAPAICYESLQPSHAEKAQQLGAGIYVASVAKSQQGVDKAMRHFPEVARRFSMPVFMANAVGFCDNFLSAGSSSVWTKEGKLVAQFDDKQEGILVFDTETEEVTDCTL